LSASISVLEQAKVLLEIIHVASIALYFGKIPTEFDPEQVHDFVLSSKVKTPSQTYFKHTVCGLRFC
jgi:hypothetical protein